MILYLDGGPCEEKAFTQEQRERRRKTALDSALVNVAALEHRVDERCRIRKQHHLAIKKHVKASFLWNRDSKKAFVAYMRGKGWDVRECLTEADVEIAKDCQAGDVVITRDSDFLIYSNITTIWRPVTRDKFLIYDVAVLQATLHLNRVQLTVLGITSRNDYGPNIASLGPASNYGIVKTLDGKDPAEMLHAYLSHKLVTIKNVQGRTFEEALRVFAHLTQTPRQSAAVERAQDSVIVTHSAVVARYARACQKYEELKAQNSKQKTTTPAEPVQNSLQGSGRRFNRYRTVVGPPGQGHQSPKPRARYSIRIRRRRALEPEPPIMKRYEWKAFKEQPQSPDTPPPKKPKKAKTPKKPRPPLKIDKMSLVRALSYEHPAASLEVGTLKANAKEAIGNDPDLVDELVSCIRGAARQAGNIKRKTQRLLGLYIEQIQRHGVQPCDVPILDLLCPRITPKEPSRPEAAEEQDEDGDQNEDEICEEGKENSTMKFVSALMRYVYSGKQPKATGVGPMVSAFIRRLEQLGIWARNNSSTPPSQPEYRPTDLVRSVASQLSFEIRKMYRQGTYEISDKLKTQKDKGLLPSHCQVEVDPNKSAIENFLLLNNLCVNRRRIVPMTGSKQPFMTFSEKELAHFFFQWPRLRAALQMLAWPAYPSIKEPKMIGQNAIDIWLSCKHPGILIKHFLSDVAKEGLTKRQLGKAGYKGAVKFLSLPEIRDHLKPLREPNFDPANYDKKGYILRGSVRTDGFRLQLLGFKIKELQSVRYKQLPEKVLPERLTSTVGGVDYHLAEVRNIIKTKEDVSRLWPNTQPEDIKVVGMDLGQAYVVGFSALLPTTESVDRTNSASTSVTPSVQQQGQAPVATFYNMAVNQKAVYQPLFKFRHWSEEHKSIKQTEDQPSISEIESGLPPQRGEDASVFSYITELEKVEEWLDRFYNGDGLRYKRHEWDARRAYEEEFAHITDRILQLVGGSIGAKRDPGNMVAFAIGLGDFASNGRLTSLHTSFKTYFVQKVRSLGYIVLGANEYYTSKKCPVCKQFVAQVEIRRLFCPKCKTYIHRDVLGGHNIANVVQGHILQQERPLYLQPVARDGSYPWATKAITTTSPAAVTTSTSTRRTSRRSSATKRVPKRALSPVQDVKKGKRKKH
ncbi:hypothetical protein EC968_006036 [Mortierella alpina]|nr:hypothetical protein EC968_006036 [Mortierella alpina]